jgi:hypothetical protein
MTEAAVIHHLNMCKYLTDKIKLLRSLHVPYMKCSFWYKQEYVILKCLYKTNLIKTNFLKGKIDADMKNVQLLFIKNLIKQTSSLYHI